MSTRSRPVLTLRNAALGFGARTLWHGLDLDVHPGEFLAVLGGNGVGKSSLLKAILGLLPLRAGDVLVRGRLARRGSDDVGYIPQQRLNPSAPLRARDLVTFGVDGHRWGPGPRRRARARADRALAWVGATGLADRPVHLLSGGEQQRVRIAQALVTDPTLLLCDEPLVSLDLRHQRDVVALIDARRRAHGTAVLFVTHEINPVLAYVDRVLYLASGRFRAGTVEQVMNSAVLSDLYGTRVEVIHAAGRILVVGADQAAAPTGAHHR